MRSKRMKADWVYRFDTLSYDATGEVFPESGLGTYSPAIIAISAGFENAQGHILYDSQNYMARWAAGGHANAANLAPQFLSGPARAEGRRPTILAVEGVMFFIGSDWALGSELSVGCRIGVFEQDPAGATAGSLSLPPAYTMWATAATNYAENCTVWANNGRNNAWERRPFLRYTPGAERAYIVQKVSWRGRRRLEPNECFALYTELENGSNACTQQFWLRTLVADEG